MKQQLIKSHHSFYWSVYFGSDDCIKPSFGRRFKTKRIAKKMAKSFVSGHPERYAQLTVYAKSGSLVMRTITDSSNQRFLLPLEPQELYQL
ncbi:hypothetical protein RZS08_20595 [Arthrospira platensis SPKY1]|nr:hypothetical protein [Arthrospira platensis SPKY1]